MSDKIGVLGSSNTASVQTTTAYTVPAGKAARFKIFYYGEAHASNSSGDLTITVNGIPVMTRLNMAATQFVFSAAAAFGKADQAAAPDGIGAANTAAPGPEEFFASAADTVTYTIGTDAMVSFNLQVVGTEIDV